MFLSGMGAWNGIARSKDLRNWTYGRGTGQGWHSGAMCRPGWADGTIGPYNAWLAAHAPPKFTLNADPANLPIWDGNSNDPDICCGDSKHEFSPSFVVYGVSSQGRTFLNKQNQTLGSGFNAIGRYDGTLQEFLSSYF